jgi:pimeloyl-ACP methyl ester carboxylesterase
MNEIKEHPMKGRKTMTDNFDALTQSNMVDLPGGRFHYLIWGTEQKEFPCVLLLHGITSSALSWVRVGPALANRYRVYALDMRGHGDSAKPSPGAYSLRQTADDVVAFIQALGLKQSVLIGHSWGGATAIVLTSGAGSAQPPPDFSHIILEDPALNFGRGNPEERAAEFTRDIGRPAEELRAELRANNPGWTAADIEGKIDALSKVSREAVVSAFKEGGQMGSLLPLLSRLPAPTLLLRADPALETTMDEAVWDKARHSLPPHSRALQIDGAAHNIHRTKFKEFMQVVEDFLKSEHFSIL